MIVVENDRLHRINQRSGTLEELAYLARGRDLLAISDEVYDRLLFDGLNHESLQDVERQQTGNYRSFD